MRICLLTRGDLFPANHGAAVKIVRTVEALSSAGASVFVVTDDRDHYWSHAGGEWVKVPFAGRFRALQEWPPLPRLGRLAESLCADLGYPREEFFLYTPQFDPAWWLRAVEVGRRERIDVFQAEFPGYGVPAWLASKLLGRIRAADGGAAPRSVIVQHNVEWDRLEAFGHKIGRIRTMEQGILDRVDEVIAVSLDDRQRMVDAGTGAQKITVIPHGVDVDTFSNAAGEGIRARYQIPRSAPLLFFHGTLHYWPNTEAVRFIAEQLLPALRPLRPDVRILISGLSPPRYYDHPAIVFSGPVEDLAAHIAAADVCLCPITAGGGTRMKLLEYMAAGKPIVSTAKGAEGIQYTDGQELDVAEGGAAFAAAVHRLLGDPGRQARLGRAARRFAEHYDWRAVGQAYLALYQGEGRGSDWNQRLLARSPRAPVVSALTARRLEIEAHLPPRTPSKPLTMLLLINRGCNLRCTFCDLWDDHQRMAVEGQLLPLLDDAVAIGTQTLVITGGEPFLHRDLYRAVQEARQRGLAVNITTNGTLVEKRWAGLVESGVNSLSFSLDGLAPTHDRIRGMEGGWDKTWAAMRRVQTQTEIATSVYMVVTRDNVGQLPELYERVRETGAQFDFWPVNDAPDQTLQSAEDQQAWLQAVEHVARFDPEVARRRAYYLEGLDYHRGVRTPVRCLGLVDQYGVKFDGSFIPCCVWGFDELVLGNVFETPLRELWRAPKVQAFREKMYSEGCEVGCFNHSLYEFQVSTGQSFRVPRQPAG